jgi:hypothetical protein
LLYRCPRDLNDWYEGDRVVLRLETHQEVAALGNDGLVITRDGRGLTLMNLSDPDVGLSRDRSVPPALEPHKLDIGKFYEFQARAIAGGFKIIALEQPINGSNGPMTLLATDAMGNVRKLGTYPALPAHLEAHSYALDADDNVYVMGHLSTIPAWEILKLTLTGDTEVTFRQSAESFFYLSAPPGYLFTGP